MTREQALALSKKILGYAKVPETQVGFSTRRSSFLRFARNQATTSGETEVANVSVTSWKGKRRATATANLDLSPEGMDEAALKKLVADAEELAAISPEDREYMPLLGEQEYLDVDAFDEGTAALTPVDQARRVGAAIELARERKVVSAGFLDTRTVHGAIANSAGLFHYHPWTQADFSITVRTSDEQGSGYSAATSHRLGSVDLRETAALAADKAIASRGARELEPGDYPTILEPQAVADLLRTVPFDARRAEEGRSVFAAPDGKTRVGEKVFDESIDLSTDPTHSLLPSTPLGPGGHPTAQAKFVRKGKLETLTSSRFWAQKQERAPGPFASNLILAGRNKPLSEIIAETERGVLVTRFWYIRAVDVQQALYTGLTRDGTFWVEDGEIQHPVKNFRFNESAVRMLGDVRALGAQRRVDNFLVPPISVGSFRYTSLSDAI